LDCIDEARSSLAERKATSRSLHASPFGSNTASCLLAPYTFEKRIPPVRQDSKQEYWRSEKATSSHLAPFPFLEIERSNKVALRKQQESARMMVRAEKVREQGEHDIAIAKQREMAILM